MKHEKIETGSVLPDRPVSAGKSRRVWPRIVLLTLGPLAVLAVAATIYFSGGGTVSTDNAYVHASIVEVTAQVSGPVDTVMVRDNQRVAAGEVLFKIDRQPFEIALREADAALDHARSEVVALKASYRQKMQEIALAKSDRAFAEREWHRQRDLAAQNVASRAKLDQARHDYDVAARKLAILSEDLSRIAAALHGDPEIKADDHPAVREVLARLDAARLDLERTVIRAPIAGVVSEAPRLGQYVAAGSPVFSLVADDGLWIEANFKETALTHLRPGQPVRIEVDTYPGRRWSGAVDSVSQATGAVMSVLPAQNSSGNWVKVVQRIPVRIAIDAGLGAPALRAGMSADVTIETGHKRSIAGLARSIRNFVGL